MSWRQYAAAFSAIVFVGWAASASAADQEYGRSGPYLGAGALYAFNEFDDPSGYQTQDDAWGYNIKGGYRFNEFFALEIDWDHMPSFSDSTGDTQIWQLDANGKIYPFSGIIQPYAIVGVGFQSVKDDRSSGTGDLEDSEGVGFRFGAGVDFYITRNWGLFAEAGYLLGTGGRSDYGVVPVSFGVLYRFY